MRLLTLVIPPVFLIQSGGLQAETERLHPQLDAKHVFIVGGYQQKADAEFYARPDSGDKVKINFGDLGVDDTDTSVMAEYRYRLNDKWLFTAGTYQFESSGNRSARRDFEYDGIEFEAGARVDTQANVDTYI